MSNLNPTKPQTIGDDVNGSASVLEYRVSIGSVSVSLNQYRPFLGILKASENIGKNGKLYSNLLGFFVRIGIDRL